MKKSKDSAYLPSIPLDDASALDNQVCVKMQEITNSPSVSEFSDAKEDSQKKNIGHQSQISLRMYEVHPNLSPSECFESKDDGQCNISQDVWTYSMNRMNQDEYQGILYLDVDSNSDATDGKESANSEDKYKESFGSGYFTCHSRNEDETDGVISDIRGIMSRQRSESIASLEYYRSQDVHLQISAREELQGQVQDVPVNNRHMRQSRRLPFWLWFIIAKSLGIKLNPQDKPIAATVLYTLTFMSALGYFLSNWWFTAYDIVSDYTKTTVIDGTISIFFCLLWGALGVYANKLAYKLFSHKKFLDMLRLHSKTILKMNASVVLFTLLLLIAIFNDVNAYPNFLDETCHKVSVEVLVCKVRYIFRVLYSAFAVIWNYLVAFVLISTCRTHVIGIRRFMQALEQDARAYESRYMGLAQQGSSERPILEENAHPSEGNNYLAEYTWVDEDYLDELCDPGGSDFDSNSSALIPQQRNREDLEQGEHQNSAGLPSTRALSSTTSEESVPSSASSPSDNSLQNSLPQPAEVTHSNKVQAIPGISLPNSSDSHPRRAHVMGNSEILFRYWKIQARLRLSSVALQRWMMSVICLVVMWLAMNLVLWLNYDPSLIDMANFFLPLALLPLLSSAYAEVNQEGIRLLKFICPLEERLQLLYVLQKSPLQMTVYGFTVSYSTITTASFGILLAFASKVLIQEISGQTTGRT